MEISIESQHIKSIICYSFQVNNFLSIFFKVSVAIMDFEHENFDEVIKIVIFMFFTSMELDFIWHYFHSSLKKTILHE